MNIATIEVSGVYASAKAYTHIPAGLVGATVTFEFTDPKWDGLSKMAVFRGNVTRDVIMSGNVVRLPPETVEVPGGRLLIGVYGVDADENIVIPTLWTDIGPIRAAADPSGDPSVEPSLPVWAELESRITEPDWNASPGQPGHVHHRTHKAVTAELNPVFDGNVCEYPNSGNEDFSLCQVSYDYCGVENLLGATLIIDSTGTEQVHTISQENITDRTADGYPVIEIHLDGIEPPVAVSVRRGVFFRDENDPLFGFYLSPGVHFLCIPDTLHAKSLSCLGHSKRTYYDTLHPNFLPDRRNYGQLVVHAYDEEQTIVDEETGESKTVYKTKFDHDFFDIDDAYIQGQFIRLIGVHGDTLPMVSAIPGESYTFIGFDGGVFSCAVFGIKTAAV